MQIAHNAKYNTSLGRGIENVTLRNIHFTGEGAAGASLLKGYGAQRRVRNIVIDNVTVADQKLRAAAANVLEIGAFVEGATFKQGRSGAAEKLNSSRHSLHTSPALIGTTLAARLSVLAGPCVGRPA